jgi:hypothetical protein
MINAVSNAETTPPIIGAAIRFMTSAPAPLLSMIGASPMQVDRPVIVIGLILRLAPSIIEVRKSLADRTSCSR